MIKIEYRGYIVDVGNKCEKIDRGDILGFTRLFKIPIW